MPLNAVAALAHGSGWKGNLKPIGGRFSINATVDFTTLSGSLAVAQSYVFDFGSFVQNGQMDVARTIYIDNSNCPNQVFVDVSKTPQDFPVPPYSVAILPTFAQPGSTITLYSLGGATGLTDVSFFSTDEQPCVYSGFAPVTPGFQVQSQPPAAKVITNRNRLLLANAAALVFPAVAVTRMLRFRNTGNDTVYYNALAAATGSEAAGDFTLQPGPDWTVLPYMTANAVSFFLPNGGSANVQIEAEEISF